jgi:glycosyltransferase involved in cell wall biosynthesis
VDLTVCTGTYGSFEWTKLARTRAWPSVVNEGVPWEYRHRDSLHMARNVALSQVETEWVCFLDADDELEPGYVEAMSRGTADVRGPVVRYMLDGQERNLWQPRVYGHHHDCEAECLEAGNWLVVGSVVRTELLRKVGGWRDFNWSEDWDVWLRCRAAGATFELIPDAIYRAHVRHDSRNRAPDRAAKLAAHRRIAEANGIAA